MSDAWRQTACILCSVNCGIEVKLDGRPHHQGARRSRPSGLARLRLREGAAPRSLPERPRIACRRPLRRRPDGTLRSDRLGHRDPRDRREARPRPRHARRRQTIFYYGGGGQGNHLGGAYSGATRARARLDLHARTRWRRRRPASSGSTASSTAGRAATPTGDFEHAEVAVFVGKNPWQSHGFPRARAILREIAARSDARADRHRPAPHRDRRARRHPSPGEARHRRVLPRRAARRAGAGGPGRPRVPPRAHGERRGIFAALRAVPVADYCARAGVAEDLVRAVGAPHRRRRRASRSSRISASSRRRTAR